MGPLSRAVAPRAPGPNWAAASRRGHGSRQTRRAGAPGVPARRAPCSTLPRCPVYRRVGSAQLPLRFCAFSHRSDFRRVDNESTRHGLAFPRRTRPGARGRARTTVDGGAAAAAEARERRAGTGSTATPTAAPVRTGRACARATRRSGTLGPSCELELSRFRLSALTDSWRTLSTRKYPTGYFGISDECRTACRAPSGVFRPLKRPPAPHVP